MGLYHLHVDNIGGKNSGKSNSAVGFAAYISGERIEADRTGVVYDFTQKDVTDKRIFLPENAPERFLNRATLWNEVEKLESTKNARFAKTIDAALPKEFSMDECKSVMQEFGDFFTRKGMIVDMALHHNSNNPHIHMLLTTRRLNESGEWEKYKKRSVYALDQDGNRIPVIDQTTGLQKTDSRNRLQWKRICVQETGWDKKEFIFEIRKEFENIVNDELEKKGSEDRIDCRSYKEQGVDKIPMRHESRAAREMEAKGEIVDVCEDNRRIRRLNMLHELAEAISGGIEALQDKIRAVKIDIQHELIDAFRNFTSRADNLIEVNKSDIDDVKKDAIDDSNIYSNDEDPIDNDDWWDPI